LRGLGAEYVVNSSEPEFDKRLRELCHRLGATIGFDAVASEMSARVLRAQPRGSRLLVYGALSLQASQADPATLIFEGNDSRASRWMLGYARERCWDDCVLPAKSRNCCEATSRRISIQQFRCRKRAALCSGMLQT
jgi:NADPH:quinone reductase-like Zn-dependent oxidoreductase